MKTIRLESNLIFYTFEWFFVQYECTLHRRAKVIVIEDQTHSLANVDRRVVVFVLYIDYHCASTGQLNYASPVLCLDQYSIFLGFLVGEIKFVRKTVWDYYSCFMSQKATELHHSKVKNIHLIIQASLERNPSYGFCLLNDKVNIRILWHNWNNSEVKGSIFSFWIVMVICFHCDNVFTCWQFSLFNSLYLWKNKSHD